MGRYSFGKIFVFNIVFLSLGCLFGLFLSGCQYWYRDMKGFLEHWTGTVSVADVTWSASPASQKNASGVDTVSTNARVTASIAVVNPDGYPLDATVGVADGGLHSVRVSGATASALLPFVHAKVLSPTSMTVELAPFSQVPTPASLALEHTSVAVEFMPTRSDNAMESTATRSLTLQYNTPPRMPLEVVEDGGILKFLDGTKQWEVVTNSSQTALNDLIFWAWPSGITNPNHPDYVAKFEVCEDGVLFDEYTPEECLMSGQSNLQSLVPQDIKDAGYNIFCSLANTGREITIYAVDAEGVRSLATTSGRVPHAITLNANGGNFGSSDMVTVFRTAGSSLNGGDLDIPTRSGHYLSGWSLSLGGAPLEFPYTVSASVTLYALWTVGTSGGGAPPVTPPPVPPAAPVTDPHIMYVDPVAGDDARDGLSAATALKTLQAAVDKVVAANDGSPYIINLTRDVDDSASPSYSSATSNSLVRVVPGKALSLTIKSDTDGVSRTIDAGRTANRTGRVLYVEVDATVTLQDVVVTGGYSSESGGGIHVAGGTVILGGSAAVRANEALNGGGVAVSDGTLRLDGGSISGNKATNGNGGGVSVSTGDLEMSGGEISGNTATGNGGGVYVASTGTVSMAGGAIGVSGSPNTAFKGGGIGVNDGIVFMTDGFVSHNSARDSGGGIYIESGMVEMQGGVISSNSVASGNGGGVYVGSGASFELVNGTIGGVGAINTVSSNGGGIFNAGDVTISGGTLSHNSAGTSGGGIVNNGTLSMTGGSISNNIASHNGGGVNNTGTLTMTGGSIGNNTATNAGGGIYQNGTFNMGGGAMVNLGNDVYLATGKTITITSELTGPLVANIKLPSYGVGTQLLEAGSGVDLAAAAGKFMVNMDIDSGNSPYFVDSSGKLQNN